jgi:hypothetical protein
LLGLVGLTVATIALPVAIAGTTAFYLVAYPTLAASATSVLLGEYKKSSAIVQNVHLVSRSFYRGLNELDKTFANSNTLNLRSEIFKLQNNTKHLSLDFENTCNQINELKQSAQKNNDPIESFNDYQRLVNIGNRQWDQIVANQKAIDKKFENLTNILSDETSKLNKFSTDLISNNSNMSLRMSERTFIKQLEDKLKSLRKTIFDKALTDDQNNYKAIEKYKFKDNSYYKASRLHDKYAKYFDTPQMDNTKSMSKENSTIPMENTVHHDGLDRSR